MSPHFSAVTLFCDDIREEKQGTDTLIGILTDNLQFTADFPAVLPKLGIYTRIHFPVDMTLTDEVRIVLGIGTEERPISSLSVEFLEKSRAEALANGALIVGLITKVIATPFPIQGPTQLVVTVQMGELKFVAGAMNIRSAVSPTASQPPSSQSPPGVPAS